MMGAGKSTVAPLLALGLGVPWEDSDGAIEACTGMSVEKVFRTFGERRFRQEEGRWLESLAGLPRRVVAVGGGLVLAPGRAESLRRSARTIYLKATIEDLAARLGPQAVRERPLLKGRVLRATLAELYQAREGRYRAAADLEILTSGLSPESVASIALAELMQIF